MSGLYTPACGQLYSCSIADGANNVAIIRPKKEEKTPCYSTGYNKKDVLFVAGKNTCDCYVHLLFT